MSDSNRREKKCALCNQLITFRDFCKVNPSMPLEQAQFFWNDSYFSIYCSKCYYNLPERPYRVKRRYINYDLTFRKK
ncbi:MAG: hypothetical protein ACFFCV_03545 [Promethearchaeota archaeon]